MLHKWKDFRVGIKINVQGNFYKAEHHYVIDDGTPYDDEAHRMDALRKGIVGPLTGEYVHCHEKNITSS